MKDFDKKVRACLVEEGYLLPTTDSEIEKAVADMEANPIEMPPELDDPMKFLGRVPVDEYGLCADDYYTGLTREG